MGKKRKKGDDSNVVCRNKRASMRYTFEDKFEAGMSLMGSEVKSLRARQADLEGAYANVESGQARLHGMHIAEYPQAGRFGHEQKRTRKLLLHKKEIEKIHGFLGAQGYTLVPLMVYFKNGYAKVQLALAKGKRVGDKREQIRRDVALKEARAEMDKRRR